MYEQGMGENVTGTEKPCKRDEDEVEESQNPAGSDQVHDERDLRDVFEIYQLIIFYFIYLICVVLFSNFREFSQGATMLV